MPPSDRTAGVRRTSVSGRIAALAIGTAAAGVLGWGVLRERVDEPTGVEFFRPDVERARELDPNASTTVEPLAAGVGPVRWTIPPAAAEELFPIDGRGQVYDAHTYFRYPPHLKLRRWWPTGFGRWHVVTNAQGLREDADVARTPVDLRVLVTGDSHTDGVCRNNQSFANRLEQRVQRARPASSIDCLNAGKGGYSFHHYLGVLEKFADLRPDAFVFAAYGGNDLYEVLALRRYFRDEPYTPPGAEFTQPVERVRAIDSEALAQGLLMVKHFQVRPDDVERALETSGLVLDAIAQRCADSGCVPLLVYLPPWFDVQRERFDTPWDEIHAALAIDADALAITERLADRLIGQARERGIDVLDLRPVFRDADIDLYWEREWHLHPQGHRLVGRELEAWAHERFPADG